MKALIHSVHCEEVDYMGYGINRPQILKDKYNCEIDENGRFFIEINTIEELFQLSKDLEENLIIDGQCYPDEILIHDNWIE